MTRTGIYSAGLSKISIWSFRIVQVTRIVCYLFVTSHSLLRVRKANQRAEFSFGTLNFTDEKRNYFKDE